MAVVEVDVDLFTATVQIGRIPAEVECQDPDGSPTPIAQSGDGRTVPPATHGCDTTADPDETIVQGFRFKPGRPLATRFETDWYTNSARSVQMGAQPTGPILQPSNPRVDFDGNAITVSDARLWFHGSMTSTMPSEGEESDEINQTTTFYGKIAIWQDDGS